MTKKAPTTIAKDSVVSIHYTLRGDDKQIIDTSEGGDPLLFMQGHGQIIPGLERALVGKAVGEKLSVEVDPADGYGDYDAGMTMEVPKDQFPKEAPLEIGAMFELVNSKNEPLVVRVTALADDKVTIDANHPLAGKKLFFEVEVASIRAATESELEHGHAHGGDGHHHH